jgi:hypothetical protein
LIRQRLSYTDDSEAQGGRSCKNYPPSPELDGLKHSSYMEMLNC